MMKEPYKILRYYVGPPLLIFLTTIGVHILVYLGADETSYRSNLCGDKNSWMTVAALLLWAFLSLWVPGREYKGPETTFGYIPKYKENGLLFFILSVFVYIGVVVVFPSLPTALYRNFGNIISTCNVLAHIFCIFLLVKGKTRPTSDEKIEPKPLVYEYYRGMELHPRMLGVDVKQLTNCRFGLLAWELLVVTFFVASWERNGFSFPHLVSVFLQSVYLLKFYYWETGYFNTLDIILDRAGFYICWGCLVFVPSLYTFTSYFLVTHPPVMSNSGAVLSLFLGLIAISLNYRVDYEKECFKAANGKCFLWGKPAKFIDVRYETKNGVKKSKLLISGFWGVARHLNYTFELLLALSWCLPGLGYGFLPFIYFIFLTVLLVHRVFRDEEKCKAKYGTFWDDYCKNVQYRMIPYVF